jgi:hypothetical protein
MIIIIIIIIMKKCSYVNSGEVMLFQLPGEQTVLEKIALLLRYLLIYLFIYLFTSLTTIINLSG